MPNNDASPGPGTLKTDRRRVDAARLAQALDQIRRGSTVAGASRDAGISARALRAAARDAGIALPGRGPRPLRNEDEVIAAINAGKTQTEIKEQFGVGFARQRKIAAADDLTFRPGRRPTLSAAEAAPYLARYRAGEHLRRLAAEAGVNVSALRLHQLPGDTVESRTSRVRSAPGTDTLLAALRAGTSLKTAAETAGMPVHQARRVADLAGVPPLTRRPARTFTDTELEQIIAAVRAKTPLNKVAAGVKSTPHSVTRALRDAGVDVPRLPRGSRPRHVPVDTVTRAAALLDRGMSLTDASELVGVSRFRLRRALLESGHDAAPNNDAALPAELRREADRLLAAGTPLRDAARQLEVGTEPLRRALPGPWTRQRRRRAAPNTPEQDTQIVKMVVEGDLTVTEAARRSGLPPNRVRGALRAAGVTARLGRRPHGSPDRDPAGGKDRQDRREQRAARNEQMLALRRQGVPLQDIASRFGMTRQGAQQVLRSLAPDGEVGAQAARAARRDARAQHVASLQDRALEFLHAEPGLSRPALASRLGITDRQVIREVMQHPQINPQVVNLGDRRGARKITDKQALAGIRKTDKAVRAARHPLLTGPLYTKFRDPDTTLSVPSLYQRFGSWTRACELAGVTAGAGIRRSYAKRWTPEQTLGFVAEYLLEPGSDGTMDGYVRWAQERAGQVPSGASVRNIAGPWNNAKTRALELQAD